MPFITTGTRDKRRRQLRETDQPAFDLWTLAHAAVGIAYGLAGWKGTTALALGIGFEILENPLKQTAAWRSVEPDARPDSLINAAVDVGAVVAGWAVGQRVVTREETIRF